MKREWYVPAGQSVWRYDVDKDINGQGEFSLLIGSLSNDNQVVTLLNAGNSTRMMKHSIAGYLHRLRRILLYQSMGCVRPLGKSYEQHDHTGHYERDKYDYEYVEWDITTAELDGIL